MTKNRQQLTLVIGNYNYSSWSFRAWLFLTAFDLPFETIRIPLSQIDTKAQILRQSKAGKVPVVKMDGMTIWDSLAICESLNEQLLGGRGWPDDLLLKALGRSVVAEMHSGFFALRRALPMNIRRRYDSFSWDDDVQADIDRIMDIFSQCLDHSGGPFLLGNFSIADCFYAPVISRFATYGVPYPTEAVRRYSDLLLDHAAVRRWFELAHEEEEIIAEEEFDELSKAG